MTIEEAIAHGREQLDVFGGEHAEFIKLSVEALEKQIPKKTKHNNEDIKLIRTNGLDESIRCALCTNPRHTERGCDGGCQVNEHLYDEVMNTIHLFIVEGV